MEAIFLLVIGVVISGFGMYSKSRESRQPTVERSIVQCENFSESTNGIIKRMGICENLYKKDENLDSSLK